MVTLWLSCGNKSLLRHLWDIAGVQASPSVLLDQKEEKKTSLPTHFRALQTISFFPKTNVDTLNSGIFSVQKCPSNHFFVLWGESGTADWCSPVTTADFWRYLSELLCSNLHKYNTHTKMWRKKNHMTHKNSFTQNEFKGLCASYYPPSHHLTSFG